MREGSLMDFNFNFTVRARVDAYHHVPGLAAILSPLKLLGERIVQQLDELKTEVTALSGDLTELKGLVTASNDKGDRKSVV